jgi:hypothetical protein
MRRGGTRVEVAVEPFGELDGSLLPALEAEAADLARFLDLNDGTLTVEGT